MTADSSYLASAQRRVGGGSGFFKTYCISNGCKQNEVKQQRSTLARALRAFAGCKSVCNVPNNLGRAQQLAIISSEG